MQGSNASQRLYSEEKHHSAGGNLAGIGNLDALTSRWPACWRQQASG
jgi:hypothetical protein